MKLQPGTLLQGDRYRIIDVLGQGGFGITYLAEQVMAERKVCIKEFFPKEYYNRDEDSRSISLGSQGSAEIMELYKAKFIKEAKTIAKLDHPNIIHIFDVFAENNTAYYVMEYIDGESLSALVKSRGVLPESEAIGYIKQVAAALGSIHEQRIMHLDIKPANVMLRKDDGRVVLIDFGLSKQYDAEGNQTSSTPVGISAGYAPMEQYQQGGVREFSPETDIYSLGATLYYLVTGVVPPQAATIVDEGLPELPAHLSANVRNAIERSMEVQRKRRPHSIKEFLALLEDNTPKVVATPTPEPVSEETAFGAPASNAADERTVVSTPTPKAQPTPQPKKEWVPKYAVNNKKEDKQKKSKKGLWLVVFAIAAVVGFVVIGGGDKEEKTAETAETIMKAAEKGKMVISAANAEAVDLGLPSGTLWATYNVGATSPEDYGNYYAWGETTTKSLYVPNNSKTYGKKMSDISGNQEYDAATANWGKGWRMPTKEEFKELLNEDNCTWTWTTQNNVNGYKVTSKKNGNSIFLPAAGNCFGSNTFDAGSRGNYWGSSPVDTGRVSSLDFNEDNCYTSRSGRLGHGQSVRPVKAKTANSVSVKNQDNNVAATEALETEIKKKEAEEARKAEEQRQAEKAEKARKAEEKRINDMVAQGLGRDGVYQIGDYYNRDGKKGVVFEVWDGGRHGKIVSLDQADVQWCTEEQFSCGIAVGVSGKSDGKANTDKIMSCNYEGQFPASEWCRNKGGYWYLPAIYELEVICNNLSVINTTLAKLCSNIIQEGRYWTSTEDDDALAFYVPIPIGGSHRDGKTNYRYVRAISVF